ncbi:MAG TPA: hypothetical protein VFJ16_19100 [Longimicrobium sp.]|nr:hypothetical protein [Longimicrobium sp.]
MRTRRRLVFDPPLAGPMEMRAENVLTELSRRGFVDVERFGTRVRFHGMSSARPARSMEERHAQVIAGGRIDLHPSGRHADVELECNRDHVFLATLVCVVLVIAPVPMLVRAAALGYAVWAILGARRGVPPVTNWVARAARQP